MTPASQVTAGAHSKKLPWPRRRLAEVLRLRKPEIQVVAAEAYRFAGVRSFGGGVFPGGTKLGGSFSYRQLTRLRVEELVYPKLMAWEGAVGIVPPECDGMFVSPEFCVFEVDQTLVLPRFLDLFFKAPSTMPLLAGMSSGTNVRRRRIYPNDFVESRIPLPGLREQHRVVAWVNDTIERVTDARRLREQALRDTAALFEAEVNAVFTRGLGGDASVGGSAHELLRAQAGKAGGAKAVFNGAHPEEPTYLEQGPHELPSGWAWTDLGSVVTHLVDCINDTPDFADEDTGLLGLKTTNVRPYSLELDQRWFVTKDDFQRWNRRAVPMAGDIILTREAPMGNACLVPQNLAACLTQRLMLLRCDNEFVSGRYLLHFLNSTSFKQQILDSCRGLTVPHIRVQDAPRFAVPLAPRGVQDAVVGHLDLCRTTLKKVRRLQMETADELSALVPAILDEVFRCEVSA